MYFSAHKEDWMYFVEVSNFKDETKYVCSELHYPEELGFGLLTPLCWMAHSRSRCVQMKVPLQTSPGHVCSAFQPSTAPGANQYLAEPSFFPSSLWLRCPWGTVLKSLLR